MTRNEIIKSALEQLGRGTDAQNISVCENKFTGYANEAILDLAEKCKPTRTDAVAVVNGVITLPRTPLKIIEITQDEIEIPFSYKDGKVYVGAEGTVDVTYRYVPATLYNASDIPEIPLHLHSLITTYVVARERASTDAGNQRGANVYFELYNAGKRSIRSNVGEADAYTIKNRW